MLSAHHGGQRQALSAVVCGKHIFSPSHFWPHQHTPSSLMMQVPVPQQRGSSSFMHMSPVDWRDHSATSPILHGAGADNRRARCAFP